MAKLPRANVALGKYVSPTSLLLFPPPTPPPRQSLVRIFLQMYVPHVFFEIGENPSARLSPEDPRKFHGIEFPNRITESRDSFSNCLLEPPLFPLFVCSRSFERASLDRSWTTYNVEELQRKSKQIALNVAGSCRLAQDSVEVRTNFPFTFSFQFHRFPSLSRGHL